MGKTNAKMCSHKATQVLPLSKDTPAVGIASSSYFAACARHVGALALFGLIPNCSVSVVVTESYLSGVLGLGGLFAGLLSNAGIGLLVLLRTNRNWKENAAVVAILYGFSVLAGIAVTLLAG